LARSIRQKLGSGTTLTREGDYNLSLSERAALARQSGAPVFVSVHANAGSAESRGTEVWIYGGARRGSTPPSQALAHSVCEELGKLGYGAGIGSGELAVLHPDYHRAGAAACLVEADYLSHPDGEARLCNAREVEALAAAIARGVRRYLGRQAGAHAR